MSPLKSKSVEAKILPRRFDLIKKMYISDKVIAANKKDLIFNWFFEQFGNFQKDVTSYSYELLWETFFEILELEKNQKNGHRILIKSTAITNLLDAVINYPFSNSWSSVILSSTSSFLQTSTVNAILIADVDKLFLLLFATLKIICKIYESDCDDASSLKEAKELANIILDILENLPVSNEQGKVALITDYLQDLTIFMHIASNDLKLEDLSLKLSKKIIAVVFNLKKKTFETLLTPLETSMDERPNPHLLNFFSKLEILLMNEAVAYRSFSVSTTCGTLLKKLLSTFLEQNKSSFNSLKVVSLFFAVAGCDIPIVVSANSCCKSLFKSKTSNFNISIFGVSELFEACLTHPQYFTSVSAPEGYLRPSIWLKGITAALLDARIKNKTLWMKCFSSLLTISPSIIESDILLLIKTALLKISVHSKDSKQQYCELFSILLQTHSKLHQVPKFFVKLLLALTECMKEKSGGNLLINGQILPQAQEAIARCIQGLPYRQMIELWKVFIEVFSTLENMSQTFMVSKGYVFFVAQLFSIFLLHAQLFQANIPSNINLQFKNLIENTYAVIRENTSALKETDSKVAPLQCSVLLLLHTVGEVKLLFTCNHDEFLDTPEAIVSEEVFDFSILHTWSDEDVSVVLESYMKSDNRILSFLVFQLLLQKLRVLDFYTKFSKCNESSMEKYTNQIQKTVSVILQHLKESSSASESWDSDICLLNVNNYGTGYWKTFLNVSRLVLNCLTPKNVYDFCSSIQNIILQDDEFESGAKFFILSSLKSGDFEDFRHFQTAFVSAIWKQDNLLSCKKRSFDDMDAEETTIDKIFTLLNAFKSKSMKYAERTPKSNKNLGSMWDQIKEVSDHLNSILLTEVLPKNKLIVSNTKNLLKFFSCLPLKYLLPGNQMKSTIGLSLIFFLIPQSCKSDDALFLCKEISQQLLTIFHGARSIWLFDFVTSGPYLKFVVRTVESVIYNEFVNSDWAVELIEHLVSLAVRNVEALSNLENCISELATQNKCSRTCLITVHALLRKFMQVLQHHKQEKYKEMLVEVSLLTLKGFINHMTMDFKDNLDNVDHCYLIKCYTQTIEIVCSYAELEKIKKECLAFLPSVLEKAINITTNSNVDALGDVYLLFISKICKHASKLSAFLPEDFVSMSWKIVFAHFEAKQEMMRKSFEMNQNLKNMYLELSPISRNTFCAVCSVYAGELSTEDNDRNLDPCNVIEKSTPFTLNEFEEESLKELSVITSLEALSEVFQRLLEIVDSFGSATKDVFALQISIVMLHSLIDVNGERCNQPLLNNLLQKILSRLNFIVNTVICCSSICQTIVLIPILDFIGFIVTGNKGLPKHVLLQNLHCLVPVSLKVQENNYGLFVTSFNAAWKVVYNLFMHHTQVIVSLPVPAPFLHYVGKLLKSLVRAGAEVPLSKCDPNIFQQVQLCGQNMNRLLTVITRNKTDFSKLAPYLVAEYVDAIQHITLESKIKESILSGIYRLLDICSEESIKMLSVNINYVCREIYTNLVKNYRQNKQITTS